MGSGNWIVDNLNSALQTWNDKLAEIWTLISTTPEDFKGGGIWNVIVSINGALQAIGYALLVLFFVMGVVKTCGSFTEIKRPEVAFKCFIRFVLAQAAVTYGMELMNALFRVAQGAISTIMDASGMTARLPDSRLDVGRRYHLDDYSLRTGPHGILYCSRRVNIHSHHIPNIEFDGKRRGFAYSKSAPVSQNECHFFVRNIDAFEERVSFHLPQKSARIPIIERHIQ